MATGHGQAVAIRTAWARPAPICFLLEPLGVLPMLVLTPPSQVPDEQEHFHRAYQLSELQMLYETVLRCCGRDAAFIVNRIDRGFPGHAGYPCRAEDHPATVAPYLAGAGSPLDPDREEFVDFSSMVFS